MPDSNRSPTNVRGATVCRLCDVDFRVRFENTGQRPQSQRLDRDDDLPNYPAEALCILRKTSSFYWKDAWMKLQPETECYVPNARFFAYQNPSCYLNFNYYDPGTGLRHHIATVRTCHLEDCKVHDPYVLFGVPVHPACWDLWCHVSKQVFGYVNVDGLWDLSEANDHRGFLNIHRFRHAMVQDNHISDGLSGSRWAYLKGTSWLAHNPGLATAEIEIRYLLEQAFYDPRLFQQNDSADHPEDTSNPIEFTMTLDYWMCYQIGHHYTLAWPQPNEYADAQDNGLNVSLHQARVYDRLPNQPRHIFPAPNFDPHGYINITRKPHSSSSSDPFSKLPEELRIRIRSFCDPQSMGNLAKASRAFQGNQGLSMCFYQQLCFRDLQWCGVFEPAVCELLEKNPACTIDWFYLYRIIVRQILPRPATRNCVRIYYELHRIADAIKALEGTVKMSDCGKSNSN